jgi:PAS domain S-box-containing protein
MSTLEENRGARMLLALSKVSQSLQSARSPGEVYKKFGESIHELGFEATILSLDDSGKYLTTTYQSREPEKINRFSRRLGFSVNDYPVPIRNNGILDQAVNAGRTIFLESRAEILLEVFPKGVRSLIKPMVTKYGKDMHSIIAPLRLDDKIFGVMGVSGADLGENEIPAITVFAGQVSAAIKNAYAYTTLQEREKEKFRIIFESAPDAYYINDLKGVFIDGNKEAERITGYKKEELIGKSFLKLNLLPKKQLPTAAALLAKNVLGRPTGPDEFTFIRKNGSEIEVEIDTHPVNIAGKTVVLGIARDITERKRVEETLQESEERYRTIFESVNDAIIRLSKSGKIIDINDRVTDIFGYTRDDVIGKNFSKLGVFSPKDLPGVLKLFRKAVRGNVDEIREWPLRHKNGTMIQVEASASLVKKNGKVEGVVAIIRDITERKQAEDERSRSQRLLLALSQAAPAVQRADTPEGVYRAIGEQVVKLGFDVTAFTLSEDQKDLILSYLTLNSKLVQAAEKLIGLSADGYRFTLTPDGYFHRIINSGETVFSHFDITPIEEILPRPLRPLATQLVDLLSTQQSIIAPLTVGGEVRGLLAITGSGLSESDVPAITTFANQAAIAIENTRLNSEKQELATFNENIIQSMAEGIIVDDVEGVFTFVNPAAANMLGFTTEELVGMHWTEVIPPDQQPIVRAADQRRMSGHADRYELEQVCKDGKRISVLVSGSPRIDKENLFTGTMAVFTDITERMQAEETLRESELRYSTLFHQSNDAVFLHNLSGKIMDVNQKALDLFGYDLEDVLQRTIPELHPPYAHSTSKRAFETISEEGVVEFEIDFIRKNGEIITADVSSSLIDIGGTTMVQGMARDITERKRAEETLREQAETIRSIVDSSQDWIWAIDLQGIHTYSNPAIEHILGYQSDELVGKPSFDLMHEEDRQMIATEMPRWISEKRGWRGLVIRWRHRDGRWRYLESSAVPIIDANGQIVGFRGVDRDITERKHMEEAEQEQRMLAEALAVTAAAINSTLDVDAVLEGILDGIRSVLPYDAADISLIEGDEIRITASRGYDEFETHNLRNLTIPLDQTPHSLRMVETAQPEVVEDVQDDPQWVTKGVFNGIGEWIRAYAGAPIVVDGFVIGFIHLNSKQPAIYNGKAATWLKAFADQAAVALRNAQLYQELEKHSEHMEVAVHEATQELRDEKERVEIIVGNSPDAILLLSPLGTISLVNKAFENLFGYSTEEARGMSLCAVMGDASLQECNRVLQTLIDQEEEVRVELTISDKESSVCDAELALSPILVGGDLQGIVASIRDITALKQVERMKDAFVSNVSHELRTPITSLRLNHNLLQRDPGERKYLDRFDREITRLNQLIEDLLRLSRLDQGQVELNLEAVDLNDLMAETTQDRVALAESHELDLVLICQEAHIPPVQADANLLGQVLSVLLTNAIQYTPAGGHIDVCAVHEQRDGARWVGFRVRDDGLGISSDDLSHLFERFYRGTVGRKSGSPGTGLGLSIASEIVQRHRGHIEVKSKGIPGEGTTFTVLLPVANGSDRSVKGD